ncbi:hypothetical protein SB725_34040, partial [Pseudomonas sp. SIMBA_041]|uniref:hypothetical protein n=1 Tax=Pseudomonas sp. SIMBA_041 TaxID=3085782 RepID=UPI00397B9285
LLSQTCMSGFMVASANCLAATDAVILNKSSMLLLIDKTGCHPGLLPINEEQPLPQMILLLTFSTKHTDFN